MILPIFPLGCTLLPGGSLPLHVFEDRYRQLVGDLLSEDRAEFGVVLIERGSEVGGGEERTRHGTVARILQCRRFPDGRYALQTGGVFRFVVDRWLDDRPYPSAIVVPSADRASAAGAAFDVVRLRSEVRRLNALAIECGAGAADLGIDLSGDPSRDLWRLIDASPLGHHDRHRLLAIDDLDRRWERFHELLEEVRASLLARLQPEG